MKSVINIYSSFFDQLLDKEKFDFYYLQLPDREQKRVGSFRRWEDATASIIGKALLIRSLQHIGANLCIADMKYTEFNRPFFESNLDFNIAHSNNYVVCAITTHGRIGIDIERVNPIHITDYKGILANSELTNITNSTAIYETFYRVWTKKEAIVKADGRGFNIKLCEIDTTCSPLILDEISWYTKNVFIAPGYVTNVAFNNIPSVLNQIRIEI
ncbi:4'-phosphopantetheinyl transferase superfamily protein [uncultured Mucilaginibacter sp.]|uniref:4'-phosphopantetheinyl transferase family protein n=1 Tax=uncultured Mucilaginibacter sp. TaxID=797541 RepID=UPI0025DC48A9|nr:4'-phosphopantetheinyl transferase superfamily protein [uncultured Mucilaginibacter sp.]